MGLLIARIATFVVLMSRHDYSALFATIDLMLQWPICGSNKSVPYICHTAREIIELLYEIMLGRVLTQLRLS